MDPASFTNRSYDTDLLILRTLFALNPDTNLPISSGYILTTDGVGGLVWENPYWNLSTMGPGVGYLPSTLQDIIGNVSSLSTIVSTLSYELPSGLSSLSSFIGNSLISSGIFTFQLNSTVEGLGSAGYISSTQLFSTVEGLGSASYVSTPTLNSTTAWFLDPSRYVSTGALVSTTAAFLENPTILSTVQGLGSAGYISTASFYSTINAFSTLITSTLNSTFFSTIRGNQSSFASTIVGLGSLGYLSSPQLISTVQGLGSAGYVSTAQLLDFVSSGSLVSTTIGISTNIQTSWYIDNGYINILGGTVVISSAISVVYLSSFVFSSMTYQGTNGQINGYVYPDPVTGPHLLISTANVRFDQFSSYITSKSRLYLDIYPNFVFSRLNTGASAYQFINMSTFLAYGETPIDSLNTSYVVAQNKTVGFGNPFTNPMKIQLDGSLIANNYTSSYFLYHNLLSSITSNLTPGFIDGQVNVQFGSTNSLFLTIQNLP